MRNLHCGISYHRGCTVPPLNMGCYYKRLKNIKSVRRCRNSKSAKSRERR